MLRETTVQPYDYDIYNTRGTTPTQLDELTGQAKTETSLGLSINIMVKEKMLMECSKVTREGSILQSKDNLGAIWGQQRCLCIHHHSR